MSELSEVVFDYNFIKEWTGISDSAYNNLYRALGYASTIVIVTYFTLTKYYELVSEKNLAKSLGKEVKELRAENPHLKEAIDKLPNPNKKNAKWDLFDDAGNSIPKSELYKNRGNGYYVSKANPNVKIPVKDGFPVFDDFSQATISIENGFGTNRTVNFKKFNK